MKDLLTKITAIRWTTWLLIVIAIFLLIMAFRSCKPLPSHKQESKSLDSVNAALLVRERDALAKNVFLTRQKDSLQRVVDTAQRQLQSVREDLSARVIAVRQTLASGEHAARMRDTAAIVVNWDSLRAQVAAGLPVVAASDSLSQAVIAACVAEGAIKDSIAANYLDMWQATKVAYGQQREAYRGLMLDYAKANTRLKFNKTLSRGLALVLLAAGAKIFIFK